MATIPNLLGVHALVWVGGWSKDQCREAIKNSKEAGYGLIEIPALDPASIDTEDGATMIFKTDKGAQGSLVLSQVSAGRKNKLWFSFESPTETFVFDQEV